MLSDKGHAQSHNQILVSETVRRLHKRIALAVDTTTVCLVPNAFLGSGVGGLPLCLFGGVKN